jgi:hypothetical protein
MIDNFNNFGLELMGGVLWPVVWSLIKIIVVVAPLMGCVAYLTLWERKANGRSQIRPGPNRVGPFGLQGNHPPDRGEQGPVLPRPGDDHHAGAGRLGGSALRP